ncbi:hypothetical protein FVEN_g11417 [Fusarium venenatum]|nr:hypothetical protein FVEN_g11417 [Fusarium venenatum]
MPRGPYDTTGVVKPGAPKPPKGKKCPQLVPTSVMSQRASGPHCNTKPTCVLQRHAHCFCNDDIDYRSK